MVFFTNRLRKIRFTNILFLLIFIGIFVSVSFIPISVDYEHYLTSTRAWLQGSTQLYDKGSSSFYYMPWSLAITVPLAFLPDRWGQALLNTLSIFFVFLSLRVLVKKIPWWATALVLANLFTINLIFSAQWDGLILGGIALGWWAIKEKKPLIAGLGIAIVCTKPTNVYFLIIMLVIYVFIKWDKKSIILFGVAPLSAIFSSFLTSGINWPLRFFRYVSANPPPSAYNIAIWNPINYQFTIVAFLLFIFVWLWVIRAKKPFLHNEVILVLALLGNLLVSSYVLSYHYIYTMPAFGWLSKERWYLSLLVYGLMIYYLFRVAEQVNRLPYCLYPCSIFVLCLIHLCDKLIKHNNQSIKVV